MPLIASNDLNVIHLLKSDEIIPDVFLEDSLSSSSLPSPLLEVDYPQGHQVVFGNSLTPVDTKECPVVKFVFSSSDNDASNAHYTLIMTDPDAPSRQNRKFGYWRHWVVTNVHATEATITINADIGEQHTPYIGPGPGLNTGVHRYLFLLYKQRNPSTLFPPMKHEDKPDRRNFDFHQFAKDHHLDLVAFNYFLCITD
ncbi:phosphatidylethanolamine-binding protein [Chlamydoabsidia padenii]|nr:phosphatidylethanolamine-binding protein [Chlamydoabsidia padenii]